MKNMYDMAEQIREQGPRGDDILAHINPMEAMQLMQQHGGTINPATGLPAFGFWDFTKKYILPVAGTVGGALIGGLATGGAGAGIGANIGGMLGSLPEAFSSHEASQPPQPSNLPPPPPQHLPPPSQVPGLNPGYQDAYAQRYNAQQQFGQPQQQSMSPGNYQSYLQDNTGYTKPSYGQQPFTNYGNPYGGSGFNNYGNGYQGNTFTNYGNPYSPGQNYQSNNENYYDGY